MDFFSIKCKKGERGFTLIEAVVATAVFALAFTSIVGVFLAIMRINERSKQVRLVEQNARYVTEFITREVRNGQINYNAYTSQMVPANNQVLHIIDKNGTGASFQLSGTTLTYNTGGALGITTNLTSAGINVTYLRFYIQPLTNPFGSSPGTQPKATIVLGMESSDPRNRSHVDLQTTATTRYYPN